MSDTFSDDNGMTVQPPQGEAQGQTVTGERCLVTTHAESIDLVDMVTAQLAELGAEGLFCPSLGCACSLSVCLMPCGEPQTDCEPGRVVEYGADGLAWLVAGMPASGGRDV